MIYRKNANFPYPILTNTSSSYESSQFLLDVELQENVHNYRFEFRYEIDSDFINSLLKQGKAELILVIQSKDNKFYRLKPYDQFIEISKSRMTLSSRTSIQMFIQSKAEIDFRNNDDLSEFYQQFKDQINVPKNAILGFSEIVMFDGGCTKPLEMFEKKLDPNLSSDIKIELGSETIIIHYKDEQLQFNTMPKSGTLNNPYIYMGLQKALQRFIARYGEDEELVDLDQIDPPTDPLDFKLFNLMKKKMVDEVTIDTIDEVIYKISDRMMEKYTAAVKGLISYGA